jgi:hypothetical protein
MLEQNRIFAGPQRLGGPLAVYLMIRWPVSVRVGNVQRNDLSLIEPIAAAG